MSEYQWYEFLAVERPLTEEEQEEVEDLSSHIEVTPTSAVVEYNYGGDFKYDAVEILEDYFDGFLYWANWGSSQLALRFPHGLFQADLLDQFDFSENVEFRTGETHDVLSFEYGEMEHWDEWIDFRLKTFMGIRDELLVGDVRALYIVWLADQYYAGRELSEEEIADLTVPPVPAGFDKLTTSQQTLATLLHTPEELLYVVAQHSPKREATLADDFAAWIEFLPEERRKDYLLRLANNEQGLYLKLVRELRALNPRQAERPAEGERIPYAQLEKEAEAVRQRLAAEQAEREEKRKREHEEQIRQAREERLTYLHAHQDTFWTQVEKHLQRQSAVGYDEATKLLVELRDAATRFQEEGIFQARFATWIMTTKRRPAFIRRLQEQKFAFPFEVQP